MFFSSFQKHPTLKLKLVLLFARSSGRFHESTPGNHLCVSLEFLVDGSIKFWGTEYFLILIGITADICCVVLKFVFGYKINGLLARFEIGKLIIGVFLGFKYTNISPNTKSICHNKSG